MPTQLFIIGTTTELVSKLYLAVCFDLQLMKVYYVEQSVSSHVRRVVVRPLRRMAFATVTISSGAAHLTQIH